MERKNECPLYGTRTCAILNMKNCEQCRNIVADENAVAQTEKLVETYLGKIPQGGPAVLFESDTCTLCKRKPGKKSGYAVYTFGHAEPRTVIRHLIIKREAKAGMIVPLQFAVCKKCRARMLLIDYMPLIMTVAFSALALLIISRQVIADRLNSVSELLPLILWAVWTFIGYAAGLLARRVFAASFEKKMYIDILRHPFVREMTENGWFPIPQDKSPKAVFSSAKLDAGIGTAGSAAYQPGETAKGDSDSRGEGAGEQ